MAPADGPAALPSDALSFPAPPGVAWPPRDPVAMHLALSLARRGLRGFGRGLLPVVLCLALGVAAIAAVGSLRAATEAGLAANGRRLLGGDIAVGTGAEPPPAALRAWLAARGARMATTLQLRTLLVAPSGERQLISLRAVGPDWPLLGTPTLRPAQPLAEALARRDGRYGLLAAPLALARLGLRPGDSARLGTATFTLRAALVSTPDLVSGPAIFGAPALIAAAALPGTGLVVPGAIVSYTLRAALPDPAAGPAVRAALAARFAAQGWRIRGPAEAAPGAARFITLTSRFMALVGLTALLMGGIGVAGGVEAWLAARAETLAILRCLGASARLVFAVCLLQVAALASVGIALGLAAGALVPVLAGRWLAGVLPVPVVSGVFPGPLALAAAYGALTAGAFALGPLGRAAQVPGAALFRGAAVGDGATTGRGAARWGRDRAATGRGDRTNGPARRLARGVRAATAGLAAALVGLAVESAGDRRLALWFCAAALGALVLFRGAAWALAWAARVAPAPRWPWARLGLGNLHRPGARTAPMLVAVGLGLTTLAAVALIQGNLRRAVLASLPDQAPSFFFIDLQPDQLARFRALVRATPGPQTIETLPTLRARIVAVNGVPAAQVQRRPRHRLGAARRPRPDLRRHPAAGHTADRGPVVAARLPGQAARLARRQAGPRLGGADRRGDPGERARPRHRPDGGQPARHRLAAARAQFRAGRQPRPAGRRAAHRDRHRAGGAGPGGRPAARGLRRVAQRHRHRRARTCCGRWRGCSTRSPRRWPPPARSPCWPERWCWPRRWRRGSSDGCARR